MLPPWFSNMSTPALERGTLQAPGRRDHANDSRLPSHLGAHEKVRDPKEGANPGASTGLRLWDNMLEGTGLPELFAALEKGHCWPE